MPSLKCSVLRLPLKCRNIAGFVSKTKNPAILAREVAQKSCIQQERVIPVVVHILLLKRHRGLVIVVKDRMARFEDRARLSMNAGGINIEEKAVPKLSRDLRMIFEASNASIS